jgi:adenosylhomocysteine nucleosidase
MKRFAILFLAAALLLTALCGCGSKSSAEKEAVGIISAMDNEIGVLLDEAKIDHVDTIAGVEYYVGTLGGKSVVITRAGI